MVTAEPDRFHQPTHLSAGHLRQLARTLPRHQSHGIEDWTEVASSVEESFRLVAPRKLVSELNRNSPPDPP